jgi:hypothetical protein
MAISMGQRLLGQSLKKKRMRHQGKKCEKDVENTDECREKYLKKWCYEIVDSLNVSTGGVSNRPNIQYPLQTLRLKRKDAIQFYFAYENK